MTLHYRSWAQLWHLLCVFFLSTCLSWLGCWRLELVWLLGFRGQRLVERSIFLHPRPPQPQERHINADGVHVLSISAAKEARVLLWKPLPGCSGEGNSNPLQYSCLENPMDRGAWWAAVHGVAKSQTRLRDFTFTFHFHALEKEMATHSSVLAWRIPGIEEPGGLPSVGCTESDTTEAT